MRGSGGRGEGRGDRVGLSVVPDRDRKMDSKRSFADNFWGLHGGDGQVEFETRGVGLNGRGTDGRRRGEGKRVRRDENATRRDSRVLVRLRRMERARRSGRILLDRRRFR